MARIIPFGRVRHRPVARQGRSSHQRIGAVKDDRLALDLDAS
jgi:hypothetical protein